MKIEGAIMERFSPDVKVGLTDELGTIVAISDGESIIFKNIKTDTNGE